MHDPERAMLAYARLARVSQQKQQLLGRDKFLVLTGATSCRAGWPDVAERCRELVLANNRAHVLARFPSFVDAMRTEDLESLLKRLERFCNYEQAEHLLTMGGADRVPLERGSDESAGVFALRLLQ